jgi:WD40 repeat protein/DNA-binding SARP family transcriptional activator
LFFFRAVVQWVVVLLVSAPPLHKIMARIKLTLLGEISLTVDGQRVIDFPTDKSRALLAYLALQPHRPHARGVLAGLLWPDLPERRARDNLRNTLYRVRKTLDDAVAGTSRRLLCVSRREVQFNLVQASVDVLVFRDLVNAASAHEHGSPDRCPDCLAALRDAAGLYGGELLHGFCLPDATAFEEWLLLQREYLHHQAIWTLLKLAAAGDALGEVPQTHAAIMQLIALDPYREDAHRQLMALLARQGMVDQALAQFEGLRKLLQAELDIEPDLQTVQLMRQISAGTYRSPPVSRPAPLPPLESDWREAPLVESVYGRSAETQQLRQWLLTDRSQLVALLGLGGIGKSTLAAHALQAVSGHFDVVLWRSLINAPPLDDVIRYFVEGIAGQALHDVPSSLDEKLALLLDHLRQRRCLLVLDNFETIMKEDEVGRMLPGYEGYGQLLEHLAIHEHDSCLLITSREWPRGIVRLEPSNPRLRSLPLRGLDLEAGQQLLTRHGLTVEEPTATTLVESYSGNPLALNLVAQTIQVFYLGNAAAFLAEEALIFEDIRDVLDQQVSRLAPLEMDVLCWLTVARQPTTPQKLKENLIGSFGQRELLEALRSLHQRSLVDRTATGLVVQNVIAAYLTDYLVDRVGREIETGRLDHLIRTALLHTEASEQVRQTQARLILQPICQRLQASMNPIAAAGRCRKLLNELRRTTSGTRGYAGGNILNLLLAMGLDVTGYDFSNLDVWQAYLQGHILREVDFAGADLRHSVFTDNFSLVWSLAYSPDGPYIAAGTGDGKVHIWRTDTGQPVATWKAQAEAVYALAFSPDGGMLVSGGADGSIRLWSTPGLRQWAENGSSSRVAGSPRALATLAGHKGAVQQLAFCPGPPEGRGPLILASASDDRTVRVWDLESGEARRVLVGHSDFVLSAAFSPDGTLLASGSRDCTVRLWDVNTGRQERVLTGHDGWVNAVAFSPGGQILASASEDGTIRLWELPNDDRPGTDRDVVPHSHAGDVRVMQGHEAGVQAIAFAPGGRTLASGGNDHTVRLWDVAAGQERHVLRGHTNWVRATTFSPDGRQLASGGWDHSLRLWNAQTGSPQLVLKGHAPSVFGIAFSSDGETLASASSDRIVRIWDVASGSVQGTLLGHDDWAWRVAFVPEPGHERHLLASTSIDHTVRLWDTETWQTREVLRNHRVGVQALAFNHDGDLMATGDLNGRLIVWALAPPGDPRAPQVLHALGAHATWCLSAAFSPDGSLLASGGADRMVVLWDARTGMVRRMLSGHTSGVQEVAFSPDGSLLASASWDRTIRLWEVASGETHRILQGHTDIAQGVAFSPDGKQVASSSYDHTVRLWDVDSGQLTRVLEGHTGWAFDVAFSPTRGPQVTGWLLASSSADETIRLWDSATGQCLQCWHIPGPYQGMNITGATGITEAQRAVLRTLGAIETGVSP